MDLYKVVYEDSEQEQGTLYGISVVDTPANDYEFVMLAETPEETVISEDKDKQLLTGVVLVPNQKLKRKFKNGDFYELFFDEVTIERLSQDFLKNGYQSNATYNHLQDNWLDGATVVESWIIEDPNNDKANAMGFKDLPKGTWMVTMKLSDELWQEYIKTGKAKGFSVDSYVRLEKIDMSKIEFNNKKEKMSVLKKIIDAVFGEEIKLAKIEDANFGSLTADAFELDNIVYQEVEAEMKPLADATFDYEDFTFTTDGEGKITSKVEKAVEEAPKDETVLEEVALESEQVGEFETTDGSKVYAEWLTIGKNVTNDAKEPAKEISFEVSGIIYTTDANGEIVKTEKNADSPLWVVELSEEAEVAVEEIVAEVEVIVEEVAKPLEEVDVEALMKTIEDLKAQLEIVSKEKEVVLMENVELSKQPADTKLKANPSNSTKANSTLSAVQQIIASNK